MYPILKPVVAFRQIRAFVEHQHEEVASGRCEFDGKGELPQILLSRK